MRMQIVGIVSLAATGMVFSPGLATAQCTANTLAFNNVAPLPGNPFQAERTISRATPTSVMTAISGHSPERIARDGQGRVRIDRTVGKYTIKSGQEAGSEVEEHSIIICDPVNHTMTQLDTLNKTARIIQSMGRLPGRLQAEPQSLCKQELGRMVRFPGAKSEDLGHQLIAGVEAEGVRITTPSLRPEVTTSNVREVWCSEELGAMVLQVEYSVNAEKTGSKIETALTNLQRGEPDASLFEIPADYSVSERVPETIRPLRPPVPQTPAAPSSPNSPPQK
jgi:hypothetical protein